MIVQWHADKYLPLGSCINCGETDPTQLTDEHIVPLALLPKGGDWFLPKSSCKACADITKRFERQVCGEMFGALREGEILEPDLSLLLVVVPIFQRIGHPKVFKCRI
jgi:hypothetical protein